MNLPQHQDLFQPPKSLKRIRLRFNRHLKRFRLNLKLNNKRRFCNKIQSKTNRRQKQFNRSFLNLLHKQQLLKPLLNLEFSAYLARLCHFYRKRKRLQADPLLRCTIVKRKNGGLSQEKKSQMMTCHHLLRQKLKLQLKLKVNRT